MGLTVKATVKCDNPTCGVHGEFDVELQGIGAGTSNNTLPPDGGWYRSQNGGSGRACSKGCADALVKAGFWPGAVKIP